MIKKIFTSILVLYPILSIYDGIARLNFVQIISMPFLLIGIAYIMEYRKQTMPGVFKNILVLIIIFVFISMFAMMTYIDYVIPKLVLRIMLLLYSAVMLYCSRYLFDVKYAIKAFRIISLFVCIILWIQIICYYFFGIVLEFYLPILQLQKAHAKLVYVQVNNLIIYRTKSVFLEPSDFAFYVTLELAILLFLDKNISSIKKYILAIFFTISLFASTAGTGAVFALIIWGYYIWHIYFTRVTINKIFTVIVIAIAGLFALIKIPYFGYALTRIVSSSSRVTSFYSYYKNFDFLHKWIGCGVGNYISYVDQNFKLNEISTFISGLGFIFIETGIMGFAAFVIFSIKQYIETINRAKIFVILFFLSNLFAVTLYNEYMILYLIWPLVLTKENTLANNYM